MTTTTKNDVDSAIEEYRNSRTEWLLVAWAIAGGSIGSALVILSANSVFIHALLN